MRPGQRPPERGLGRAGGSLHRRRTLLRGGRWPLTGDADALSHPRSEPLSGPAAGCGAGEYPPGSPFGQRAGRRRMVEIRRIQDNSSLLDPDWARTWRPCPPFCIQPMVPTEGVTSVGELALLDDLQDPAVIVIDSRTRSWFEGGTIPGAVSIPWNSRSPEMKLLTGWTSWAARPISTDGAAIWRARDPVLQRHVVRAVAHRDPAMIAAGYPPERIRYYRGGMQAWRLLGLTVVRP